MKRIEILEFAWMGLTGEILREAHRPGCQEKDLRRLRRKLNELRKEIEKEER